jgi:glucosamine--fructose-6-phosphate aminotransferase (isomerizing)
MHFSEGIAAQPRALAAGLAAVTAGLGKLPKPAAGDVIALVGIGASEHAARTAAQQWRAAGLRATAVSAAEVCAGSPLAADLTVAISESGRSTETLEAVSRASGPTIAVVNAPSSPLVRACTDVLDLGSGPDSPVYTTGYTATLQGLGLLGEHWTGTASDWAGLPGLVSAVLDEVAGTAEALAGTLDAARVVDVVGSAPAAATVGEGALLLRESARLLTAAHETRGYLHGPMEPLDPRTAVLVVGDGRELRLAAATADLGCPTILLTTSPEPASRGALTVVRLPRAASPLAQAVLDILPVQRLAWAVARRRGLAVDGFRYRQDDTKTSDAGTDGDAG